MLHGGSQTKPSHVSCVRVCGYVCLCVCVCLCATVIYHNFYILKSHFRIRVKMSASKYNKMANTSTWAACVPDAVQAHIAAIAAHTYAACQRITHTLAHIHTHTLTCSWEKDMPCQQYEIPAKRLISFPFSLDFFAPFLKLRQRVSMCLCVCLYVCASVCVFGLASLAAFYFSMPSLWVAQKRSNSQQFYESHTQTHTHSHKYTGTCIYTHTDTHWLSLGPAMA